MLHQPSILTFVWEPKAKQLTLITRARRN